MTHAYLTVRTDRAAYLLDEAIEPWNKPEHCSIHRVQWYGDEWTLGQLVGKEARCPVCVGQMDMALLMFLEEPRVERARQRQSV